jgi:hypothetical protein
VCSLASHGYLPRDVVNSPPTYQAVRR